MQRKVLNDLYKQGGVTCFAFPGESEIPLAPLQNLALALNAGARFLLIDFSGKNTFKGNAPIEAKDLIESPLSPALLEKLKNDTESWTVTGNRVFPKDDNQFRNLYHNLQQIKGVIPQIIAVLPLDINDHEAYYAKLISRLVVIDGESVEEASAFLEDLPHFNKSDKLWLLPQKPNKKRFYHAYRAVCKSNSFFKEIRRSEHGVDGLVELTAIGKEHFQLSRDSRWVPAACEVLVQRRSKCKIRCQKLLQRCCCFWIVSHFRPQ